MPALLTPTLRRFMSRPPDHDTGSDEHPAHAAEDAAWGEGRHSERSRQATRSVLLTRGGWPGFWLLLLVVVFAIVALVTFGLLP